jgi:GT2 family glycosyltransferase
MTTARIAAVVLNYRTPSETIAAVTSLRESSRVSDVIVVDNHSGDGSEERLRAALPDVLLIQTGRNLGYSGGNNVGIRAALRQGADMVFIVNSDVTVPPDCVARLEAALSADPRLGLAGPVILTRSSPPRVDSIGMAFSVHTGRMRHPRHGTRFDARMVPPVREVDGLMGCAVLVRRTVFEQVGLLAEEYFFSMEDLDFCLRARARGFASACIGTASVLHGGSVSVGRQSPARVYYGARNHLLLASRLPQVPPPLRWLRTASIIALNLAYVLRQSDVPRLRAIRALTRGVRDHLTGRYGPDLPHPDGR